MVTFFGMKQNGYGVLLRATIYFFSVLQNDRDMAASYEIANVTIQLCNLNKLNSIIKSTKSELLSQGLSGYFHSLDRESVTVFSADSSLL